MLTATYTQHKNFVPPVDDYNFGRRLYRQGKRRQECGNDAQRAGWDAAELQGYLANCKALYVEGMEVA